VSRTRTSAALGVLLIISFLGLNRDLWTPDEPREAEISREMWLSPSVVPSLNDRDFIEKPPLYYWTVAGVFALLGKPSAAAARAVSGMASFLTLVLVYLWGRRAFSAEVGILAAIGLATSKQFMVSSHWVLIDPLLVLFTTAAAWAGSELVLGDGGVAPLMALYASMALALWTKGLIGPVLLASGLLAYAALSRSVRPVWRLRPFLGSATMLLAVAGIAALIYAHSGFDGVREWLWVNHVQRFVAPVNTGHHQAFYYYLSALPIAVFPWWVPFADLFRPSRWREGAEAAATASSRQRQQRLYNAALCIGMLLLLSASATKRGIYLLPVLPPLFLLLAAHAMDWWVRRPPSGLLRSPAWWLQVGCVLAMGAGPTAIALGYLGARDLPAFAYLALLAALTAALVIFVRRGQDRRAVGALGSCAVAATVGLLLVTTHLAAPEKDMSPFVAWLDARIPSAQPVYVVGDIDETVLGIVPFVTGREVLVTEPAKVAELRPDWLLVQDKNGGQTAPSFATSYRLVQARTFGTGRYFALWQNVQPAD